MQLVPRRARVNDDADGDVGQAHVLVTGATGYIGGRLVEKLHGRNAHIRCVTRDISRLEGRWPDVELIQGDLADEEASPSGAGGHRRRLLPGAFDGERQ